jgi:cyclic pyranopterin phosphate synthase
MEDSRIDFKKYCVLSIWFGCNNKCGICMLSKFKGRLPEMGFDRYRSVLDTIIAGGRFRNLILSGGEVTTFAHLEKYVNYAASLGWFDTIQIQTNGRRLSDRKYLDRLIRCGVNEFFVSIHGIGDTHDRATGIAGSFEEVLRGLANLSLYTVKVISNTVLTKNNIAELKEFLRFVAAHSAEEIHLWNYFPMEPRDTRDLLVRCTDVVRILPELKEIVKAAGKTMVLKSFPLCLYEGPPVFFDSVFPATVLPDLFWREFGKSGFGRCPYRERGECTNLECWGLSSAYMEKYGNERALLKPIGRSIPKATAAG